MSAPPQQSILIVDDTPANLRLLGEILAEKAYRVRSAPNGDRALATVQKELPDLILLDIMMPELDGYAVCRQLKAEERTRDIPVIFISALNDVFDKLTAFSAGGVDYINKPFEAAEVLARVETHLTLHQLRRDLAEKNKALLRLNESLEEKVQARTLELAEANKALTAEIEQRIRHQTEKDQLFNVVSQQSEQLRQLTNWLIQAQQRERQGLASSLQEEIEQNVALLQSNLRMIQTLLSPQHDQMITKQLERTLPILEKMEGYVKQVASDLNAAVTKEADLSESPLLKLTVREREVLRLMAQGKTNAEIADLLAVAVATVHTYVGRIKQKLDIPNLPGLIKFALQHDLVAEPSIEKDE